MEKDNILENCKKAAVFDDDGDMLCEAAVQSGPMGGVMLVVPRTFGYRDQKYFIVTFYDPILGVLTCRCTFSSPLIMPEQMCSLRCEVVEQLSREQRRQDIKVPVGVKVKLQAPYRPGDTRIPEGGWPATALNISAGGVYIKTDLPLAQGRRFSFTFSHGNLDIPLNAKILRVDDVSTRPNQKLFGYGCKFVELPARYESQLRSFVFREEMRLYKKDRPED